MGEARFRTRRQWHNTAMVAWVAPFAALTALIVAMSTGNFVPLGIILALLSVALVVALLRDRTRTCIYTVEDERVTLSNGRESLVIPIADIVDASLIDRIGAREYIRQQLHGHGSRRGQWRTEARCFTRFCTVDIGLTTFTLGLGRSVIDRMPNARHDLVLLRMRNGEALVLSPLYNQDLVGTLGRRLAGI
ncbi:MAG: hypothetical protein R2817_06890 [Flavobacteriales bacterium]